MNQSIQQMELFHTLFILFLMLAIVTLGLTVSLFFAFDIRRLWSLQSGRARQKSIGEIEKATAISREIRRIVDTEDMREAPTPPMLHGSRVAAPKSVITTPSENVRDGGDVTSQLKVEAHVGNFVISKKIMLIQIEEFI